MTQPVQKSKIVLCLLRLIESGRVGLPAEAAAANVIAANARFNLWFLEQKRDPDGEDLLRLLDVYDEATRECQATVQSFHGSGDRKDLVASLYRVAEKLNRRPERMPSRPHASDEDLPPRRAK